MPIAFSHNITYAGGGSPVGLGFSVSPGQLLVLNLINQSGSGQTPAITDSVNTGDWNVFPTATDGTRFWATAWIACNGSGTPTITTSGVGNSNGIAVNYYNGFLGTASYAGSGSSDFTVNYSTASPTTAVSGTSFNTSKNSELVCAFVGDLDGSTWATAPSAPWNLRGSVQWSTGRPTTYDQIVSTSGTAVQLTGTLSAGDYWFVTQAGFYDNYTAPSNSNQGILLMGC
jgi:hypothetical protein